MTELKNKKEYIITAAIFALLIFTIAFNIDNSAMWGDEWTDYTFSRAGIKTGELYSLMISTVLSPPLFYYVMHVWLLISESVIWFRSFNILIGLLSGLFLYFGIKRKCGIKYAWGSVAMLSLCFQWVYCMQDGSEYGFMLFFLFGALYFFIRVIEEFKYKYMIMFVLFSVGGIWTHYGSVFVTIPMLMYFFLYGIFGKNIEIKNKIGVVVVYILSFLLFAIPLVKKYLLIQLAFNSLSSHILMPKPIWFLESLFDFGRIVGFMFSVNNGEIRNWILSIVSLFLIITCLYVLFKSKDTGVRLVVGVLVLAYAMHFGLVKMHYYAMLHENMTSGFYSRYSYFYIPLLAFVLPLVIHEYTQIKDGSLKYIKFGYLAVGLWFLVVSIAHIAPNWNKSYDDIYSKVWMENKGWEDDATLVYYCGWDGFNYYLPREDGFDPSFMSNAKRVIEVNNEFTKLPDRFWLWRTNWDSDEWNEVITRCRNEGYFVNVLYDYGYDGQLAYCSVDNRKCFEADSYSFSIEGWEEKENELIVDLYCDKLDEAMSGNDYYFTYNVRDRFDLPLRKGTELTEVEKTGENRFRVTIDTSAYVYDHYRVVFELKSKTGLVDDGRLIKPNISLNF